MVYTIKNENTLKMRIARGRPRKGAAVGPFGTAEGLLDLGDPQLAFPFTEGCLQAALLKGAIVAPFLIFAVLPAGVGVPTVCSCHF